MGHSTSDRPDLLQNVFNWLGEPICQSTSVLYLNWTASLRVYPITCQWLITGLICYEVLFRTSWRQNVIDPDACNIKHSGGIWANTVNTAWFSANFPGFFPALYAWLHSHHTISMPRVHLEGHHWLTNKVGLIWCETQEKKKKKKKRHITKNICSLTLQDRELRWPFTNAPWKTFALYEWTLKLINQRLAC